MVQCGNSNKVYTALPKTSNHLIEIKDLLGITYKANKHLFFFFFPAGIESTQRYLKLYSIACYVFWLIFFEYTIITNANVFIDNIF